MDTSVLPAAAAEYCIDEVERNIGKIPCTREAWEGAIRPALEIVPSVFVLDYPVIFSATKDRSVLLSALGGAADYLITLDKRDFAPVLGTSVYGLRVRTPETFLLGMDVIE